MDPDIMYTYNGDNFDCSYAFENKLYGLANTKNHHVKELEDGEMFNTYLD
jgi:DNA polymerase elongation subunit (family B)